MGSTAVCSNCVGAGGRVSGKLCQRGENRQNALVANVVSGGSLEALNCRIKLSDASVRLASE